MGVRPKSATRRQIPIDCYIADFACLEAKLVVEVDGLSHGIEDQAQYDVERTAHLNELGWRVLRLSDNLILSEPDNAAALIIDALRCSPSP